MSNTEPLGAAKFSPCRKFRYTLHRELADNHRLVQFILLNPSKADEYINDNTVTRCLNYSRSWGFGRALITNIFAWRSTDPRELKQCTASGVSPIGLDNDAEIIANGRSAEIIVCGWGKHGDYLDRGKQLTCKLLDNGFGFKLHYLKILKDGSPSHPLYLSKDLYPKEWKYADSYASD